MRVVCLVACAACNISGPLVTKQRVAGFAVDDTSVYWADRNAGRIGKATLAGGGVQTFVADQTGAAELVVDATNLYWFNSPGSPPVLASVPRGGGTVATLASAYPLFSGGLASNGTSVFFPVLTTAGAELHTVPVTGGTPTSLVTWAELDTVATSGDAVCFTGRAAASDAGGQLAKMSASGAAPTTLYSDPANKLDELVVDGTNAYVTSGGAVIEVPLAGGVPITLSPAIAGTKVRNLVVDDSDVYWLATGSSEYEPALTRVSIGGGAVTSVKTLSYAGYFGITATDLVWVRVGYDDLLFPNGDDHIYAEAKP